MSETQLCCLRGGQGGDECLDQTEGNCITFSRPVSLVQILPQHPYL